VERMRPGTLWRRRFADNHVRDRDQS
jgi:hypothetical protein